MSKMSKIVARTRAALMAGTARQASHGVGSTTKAVCCEAVDSKKRPKVDAHSTIFDPNTPTQQSAAPERM